MALHYQIFNRSLTQAPQLGQTKMFQVGTWYPCSLMKGGKHYRNYDEQGLRDVRPVKAGNKPFH
jgi:hypothetical protein